MTTALQRRRRLAADLSRCAAFALATCQGEEPRWVSGPMVVEFTLDGKTWQPWALGQLRLAASVRWVMRGRELRWDRRQERRVSWLIEGVSAEG